MMIIEPKRDVPLSDELLTAKSGLEDLTKQIIASRMEWVEAHLRELVAEGIALSEIKLEEHLDCRTVIVVRDVPRFQWSIKWPDKGTPAQRAP